MRLTAVLLALVASAALAQGTPPEQPQAPESKPAETKPPEAQAGGHSIFVVRCTEDCTVRVDGKGGLRQAPNSWEFKDVAPGQRRVEVSAGLLNRPLYNGYADIPADMKVMVLVDGSKRMTITERTPLGQEKQAQAAIGEPSVLNVRCPKQCALSIDGLRKGPANAQLVVVRDVQPGQRNVEVKLVLGTKVVRALLNIPAASEVFATATEHGITITNSKPLAK
jgi:hypothetical protein